MEMLKNIHKITQREFLSSEAGEGNFMLPSFASAIIEITTMKIIEFFKVAKNEATKIALPQTNALFASNVAPLTANVGATTANVGALASVVGATSANVGAFTSVVGATTANCRAITSVVGATTANVGAFAAVVGAQFSRICKFSLCQRIFSLNESGNAINQNNLRLKARSQEVNILFSNQN